MNFLTIEGKYKRIKTLEFLRSLQKLDPLTTNFSEISFRSSVGFPSLELEKQGKFWVIQGSIAEELYFYQYPFGFSNYFLVYKGKYEMEVKFEFLKNMSIVGLEKKFCVKSFLDRFSISNKNRSKVNGLIMDGFSVLVNKKLIDSNLKIIYKNGSSSLVNMSEMTSLLIGKSDKIYFYEQIDIS